MRWLAPRLLLLCVLALTMQALAQLPSASAGDPGDGAATGEEIERRRGELAERIRPLADGSREDAAELERLRALDGALARVIAARARRAELERSLAADDELASGAPADRLGPPPYGFAELDPALAAFEQQESRLAELHRAIEDLRSALDAAQRRHQTDERDRRLGKEELERAGPAERAGAARALEERELASEVSSAELAARRAELENAQLSGRLERAKHALFRVDLDWIRAHLQPSEREREERLDALAIQARKLEQYREGAVRAAARFEREIAAARAAAERTPTPSPALQAQIDALGVELQLQQQRQALLVEQLARVHAEEATWRRRFALASGSASGTEPRAWLAEAKERIEQTERELRLGQASLSELRTKLERARAQADEDADRARWRAREVEARAKLVEVFERSVQQLEQSASLERSWRAELTLAASRFDLRGWVARSLEDASALWRTELAAAGDSSITVGKVITALLIFVVGFAVARALSSRLAGRVLARMRVDPGVAFSYQRLVFYALLVIAFLVALRTVNIPLTAFTVAGGAIAIGVGFGSQNLVSNFISGIILLVERPIKRGDLIEIDGTTGSIERIGLRSTVVRSGDNAHVIIPNSTVLDSRLVNWTHDNPTVRASLSLGVAYGSPTEQVRKLLLRAIEEQEDVLPSPPPSVLLTGFGENALVFQASFSLRTQRVAERSRIESDLRFRLDTLLRDAGIRIAHPQREVHLGTARPLEVHLVEPRGDA